MLGHHKLHVVLTHPTTRRRQARRERPCTIWGGDEATSASIVAGGNFLCHRWRAVRCRSARVFMDCNFHPGLPKLHIACQTG
jgi:hypothetical protein